MRLDETLAELTEDHAFLGEWLYYIQIYGKLLGNRAVGLETRGPSRHLQRLCARGPGGDDSPVCRLRTEQQRRPVNTRSEILQKEQNDGLAMLNALPESQRQQAILNFSKTGNNNLTEAFKDNVVIDYAGLRTNDLSGPGRQRFRDLIHLYIENMDEGHAR